VINKQYPYVKYSSFSSTWQENITLSKDLTVALYHVTYLIPETTSAGLLQRLRANNRIYSFARMSHWHCIWRTSSTRWPMSNFKGATTKRTKRLSRRVVTTSLWTINNNTVQYRCKYSYSTNQNRLSIINRLLQTDYRLCKKFDFYIPKVNTGK